ncbi:hypothetical protein FRC12_014273 [Ceratobasidium sp. 428]|nr:hypothetical protein FRC12_014273 [Ceratobasidium sp. 428]
MISRSMSIGAVIERLVHHGCPNVSTRLDTARCNDRPYSRGGFGDVYKGTLLDGTKYAARELHTWSRCQHPNVVKLLGLAEFHDQIAMVSPWMERGSVDHIIRSDNSIDRCNASTSLKDWYTCME